jgi:3-oxoacyl-[acyl-carrier-protein] synthase II
VIGYGMSADAYHMTGIAPEGQGAQRSMRAALKDAGIQPEEVGYVNAHATSTPAGDGNESRAIEAGLRRARPQPQAQDLGTKSMTGHLLGGAGGLEAGITVLALSQPAASAHHQPGQRRPRVPPGLCAQQGHRPQLRCGLSNSFGFGGINATLIMRRWTE